MQRRQGWLAGYEPQSLGDFELSPRLDQELSILALAACDAPAVRRALFIALATKIARFSQPFLRWREAPWERDDVLQETWIAFDDLLQAWQPLEGNGPPAGFGYYFLSVYRFRLRDRLIAGSDFRRAQRPIAAHGVDERDLAGPDDVEQAASTQALLEQICGKLNGVDAALLRHRAAGLEFDPAQLRAAGITVSRRTAYRRWQRIVTVASEIVDEQRAAS